jgi:MFS family permease
VRTLEEITYEAGRSALADQESLVAGVRQRTGTLLAAHALVASFLGATTVRAQGLHSWGWVALVALVLGLVAAAILLAPWKLKFAIDARELYDELYEQAAREAPTDTLGWLAEAGYGYQKLREENALKVRRMSWLSGVLGVLMVVQTRVAGGAGDRLSIMAPKPLSPDQIKTPPTSIGIEEGRGGSSPRPTPRPGPDK